MGDALWGLLDTTDNLWLGNDAGPRTYTDETLAKVAAQMTSVQLGWAPDRIRATPYTGDAIRLRDEVQVKRSAVDALTDIETGRR